MKYSVNQRRISSVVKIVNFVRQSTAKDQICLMAVLYGKLHKLGRLGKDASLHPFMHAHLYETCSPSVGLLLLRKMASSFANPDLPVAVCKNVYSVMTVEQKNDLN